MASDDALLAHKARADELIVDGLPGRPLELLGEAHGRGDGLSAHVTNRTTARGTPLRGAAGQGANGSWSISMALPRTSLRTTSVGRFPISFSPTSRLLGQVESECG